LRQHDFGSVPELKPPRWPGFRCAGTITVHDFLMVRNRIAWYALLAYLGIGVVVPAASAFDTNSVVLRGVAFPIVGSLMNGCIGIGIYFALRPAFARTHENDLSPEIGVSDTEQDVRDDRQCG
jgi:hypothetical protein